MQYQKTSMERINKLKQEGYRQNFIMKDGKLYAPGDNSYYNANQVTIDYQYRFEGMTNPADMSILYGVSTKDGKKGIILAAYGPYADARTAEFFLEAEHS